MHRDALVRTAMRLFRRQGYAASGLQQILSESGVPRGSLYHYFPGGKEALAEAAVEMAGELIAEMLTALAERHTGNPEAFLHSYCETMAQWMQESAFHSGCPIATTVLETVPGAPKLTRIANAVLDRWISIIATVHVSGGMTPADATRRAGQIIAAMEGALIIARIRQSADPIRQVAGFPDAHQATLRMDTIDARPTVTRRASRKGPSSPNPRTGRTRR